MLDLLEEFRSVLSALDTRDVAYAVCGGLAVAIHVRPRATLDIDLLVPRGSLEPAKRALRGLGYTVEAGLRLSKPDPDTGDLLSFDLLAVTPELDAGWETRERVRWEHGRVCVVSRRGLVVMKRLRGSGQDLDDIRELECDHGEA